jgi:hypothetical protein
MTRETEIPVLKGIFSRVSMPGGWRAEDSFPTQSQPILGILGETKGKILGIIPRSSDSITLLLEKGNQRIVCQIFPATRGNELDQNLFPERSSGKTLVNLENKINELKAQGVQLPAVLSCKTHNGQTVLLTEFVEGVPGDIFIKVSSPAQICKSFFIWGTELAKLENSTISINGSETEEQLASLLILNRQRKVLNFLSNNGVFTEKEAEAVLEVSRQRTLFSLPELPITHVHLDPFPVNVIVAPQNESLLITLVDIRAIKLGHPWIEGIGRAIQWACKDWFTLTEQTPPNKLITSLTDGFNKAAGPKINLPKDLDIDFLAQTAELFWLPRGIAYEILRKNPEEGIGRRKKAVLEICQKN